MIIGFNLQFGQQRMYEGFLSNITEKCQNSSSSHSHLKGEQEYSNLSRDQHHYSSAKRQQSVQSRQRHSLNLQSKLDNLNHDLKCAGFKQLSSFCFCEMSNLDQICQIFNDILCENKKIIKKNRDHSEHIYKQNHYIRQLEASSEKLKQSEEKALRQKEINYQKYMKATKQNKEKMQKIMKEKETFAREKKGWAQKQQAMKYLSRNIEQRMKHLQDKVKKMQKSDKIEYKNIFEVHAPLNKTSQRSFVQSEYEHSVVRTIETHCKMLQQQNNSLKEQLRQIFANIQRIVANLGHAQQQNLYRQEIIELPYNFNKSKTLTQVIKKNLWFIQERLNEPKMLPIKSVSSNSSYDVSELTQSFRVLKGFHDTWQQINNKRKAIVPYFVNIFSNKQKMQKLAQMMDHKQYQQAENTNKYMQEGFDIQGYINRKIEEYDREFKIVSIERDQVQSLQSDII